MRLLKRVQHPNATSSTAEFSLIEFPSSATPPVYAILSHRWSSDEVTLEDLQTCNAQGREGYEKLKFCAQQAAHDGIAYFWIDTCCIDKKNSVELSTAINSMFKWYKNATKCYVYLSDVSVSGQTSSILGDAQLSAFRDSVWFTRGWTLQELIAPTSVEFFSKEGTRLGDKTSLEHELEEVTGLPVNVLRGAPLSGFDVDERLTWAARRNTTEEEDGAYCLLGIFDVHMPLLYSEGRLKAMDRLRRKILKSIDSTQSLTADVPWVMPFEKNPRFVGRATELLNLERQLFATDHTSKWAVVGLGGVGKTQLVIELVYRTRLKHRDCRVLWIPAVSHESLYQGYTSVARQLDLPGHDNENTDVIELVSNYLSGVSSGRWLLVFDNADDVALWTGSRTMEQGRSVQPRPYRLIDSLPHSKRGCILFTTRDRKAATRLAGPNIITLPTTDKSLATDMLKQYLVDPDLVQDIGTAEQLLAALAYLPLAIVQAAACINANDYSLADYLELMSDVEEEVVGLLSEDFEAEGRYSNVKNPVATTWLISFRHIRQHHPLAAEYLSFMVCLHYKDIPVSLLPPGPSRRKEMEAIGTLTGYSFIDRRAADSALDLHRLVHIATRNWLRMENILTSQERETCARLNVAFPDNDHENRSLWRLYLPHAQYMLKLSQQSGADEQRTALMDKCARCLFSDGRWNEAEALFAQLMTIQKRALDSDSVSVLRTNAWLASTYRKQGRWGEAEKLQVQVMKTRKDKLGPDHPDTLASMYNLALTYQSQGRWSEAEELEVQVMETRKDKLGPDHPDTLISMANLAMTYQNQGRWSETEKLEVQVMEISKNKLGPNHPDTLTSMNNLASTYWKQGRWGEAEELQVQVTETNKDKLGPDHPDTLISMNNLATIYGNQGRWSEAEELFMQMMETRKDKLGSDHPDTLTSMNNLASTYWKQGRWSEAEELQVQVIEISKDKLEPDHPDTLISMNNLASTYRKQGRWSEAEELEVQVMETRKDKLGPDHPDTLTSMNNLASTYWNQGRWSEAEELEVQVMETREDKLGPDHPSTLTSMANLAFTWHAAGREAEAIQLLRTSVQRQSQVLGSSHPEFLAASSTLHNWKTSREQTRPQDE